MGWDIWYTIGILSKSFIRLTNPPQHNMLISKLLQIATTLDPRFKSLPTTAEEAKTVLDGPIKEALIRLIDESPGDIKAIVEETPEKKKPRLLGTCKDFYI
ncbi:hypothetical protein J6590_048344 [Homalodisca vitripennis]|nr:hypothetical protein J6590_048344 [Homalodisca vitripennis]